MPRLAQCTGLLEDELAQEAINISTDEVTHEAEETGLGCPFVEDVLAAHDTKDLPWLSPQRSFWGTASTALSPVGTTKAAIRSP